MPCSHKKQSEKEPGGSVATSDVTSLGGCDSEEGTAPDHGAPLQGSVSGLDQTFVMARAPK